MTDPTKALIAAAKAVVDDWSRTPDETVVPGHITTLRETIAAAEARPEPAPKRDRMPPKFWELLAELNQTGDRRAYEALSMLGTAIESIDARPWQCAPHCTTMVTDCDYCRPEPAAEPSIIPALRKVAAINHGGDTSRAVDLLCDAVEALAREVRE